jgi:predicted ABC-type ATPase
MPSDQAKDVIVIGGPNGAGKTTWAYERLSRTLDIREFVNADEIARGISPLEPEASALAAGRLMIQRLSKLVSTEASFAFETTCSGRGHARLLERCRAAGYRVILMFLWLPSPEIALARVARRVSLGGHSIPPDVVLRRYALGLRNMRHIYLPLADLALIHDNSDESGILVAERRGSGPLIIHDEGRWRQIEEATQ